MSQPHKDVYKIIAFISDMSGILLSWYFSCYFRFYSLPASKGIPNLQVYFKLLPFIAVIWALVFSVHRLYELPRRGRSRRLLQACALATVGFIVLTYFYEEYKYSRMTLLIFALVHPLVVISLRLSLDRYLQYRRACSKARRVLVIGSAGGFIQVLAVLRQSWEGAEVQLGALLVGSSEQCAGSEQHCRLQGVEIHDLPENWADFFVAQAYDRVVLALPYQGYQFIEDNLASLAEQVMDITLVPDLQRFTKFGSRVEISDNLPLIHIHDSPLQGTGQLAKRVLDLLGASLALLLFAPLMVIIALFVKFSSPGPVFYLQKRMGLDGSEFSIFKFRTMGQAAERQSGAVWASKNDQRTTRLGKILRRTSLDELPQLLNVLRGEMSMVGPRPERPVFVAQFRKQVPGYMLRHKVKAGITGWAQVNGWRGDTSIERRIECDLYYIQHWSLRFDIKILILTIFKGFVNPNAY